MRTIVLWAALLLAVVGPIPAAADREAELRQLEKARNLERWGMLKSAEDWYRKLAENPFSGIRRQAFESWADILEKRGKLEHRAAVQERMLAEFPELAPALRKELFSYYSSMWEWGKASDLGRRMLAESQDRQEVLLFFQRTESCKDLPVAEKEDFSKSPQWSLGHPTYYRTDPLTRRFEATTVARTWYHAGKLLRWSGAPAILVFDIQIQSIEWNGDVVFGLSCREPGCGDRLAVRFTCGGGTGDIRYSIRFQTQEGEVRKNTLASYGLGVWYRIEIAYVEDIREARMLCSDKESGKSIGECIVRFPAPVRAGNYLMGFESCQGGSDYPSVAQVCLDDLRLGGRGWSKFEGAPDLAQVYQINQIAQTNPQTALETCGELLQKAPDSWQLLETRAYLWKANGNRARFVEDLQRVLVLRPQHPSAAHFMKIVTGQ